MVACGPPTVEVYRAPKEEAPGANAGNAANPHASAPPPSLSSLGFNATPELDYQEPEGWEEYAPGPLRLANFRIQGEGTEAADVAVIPLPLMVGKKLAFVNMWRENMELPAIEVDELEKQSVDLPIGDGNGQLFDFVEAEGNPGSKNRMLIVIAEHGSFSWFFKMTGAETLVEKEKGRFLSFLETLTLSETAAKPAPAISSAASAPNATKPAHWVANQTTGPVLMDYSISDGENGSARVSVTSFPGDVGGLLANVNRWRRQLGLGSVETAKLNGLVSTLEIDQSEATLVSLENQSEALISIIVPHQGQSWFFKLTGDKELVKREKDTLIQFTKSVRFPNG